MRSRIRCYGLPTPLLADSGTRYQMAELATSLDQWLASFPEDTAALYWSISLGLARADFKTVLQSYGLLYKQAVASSKQVCSRLPIRKEKIYRRYPHTAEKAEFTMVGERCQSSSAMIMKVGQEWARCILLAEQLKNGGPPTLEAVVQAFEIKTRAYKDQNALHPFGVGPSALSHGGLSWPPYVSRGGLHHHQQQLEHLSEIVLEHCRALEGNGQDTTAPNHADPNGATAMQLMQKFDLGCNAVAKQLRQIAQVYERAIESGEAMIDRNAGNLTDDVLLAPAESINELTAYMARDLHWDPSGALIEGKSVLMYPPGSSHWENIQAGIGNNGLGDQVIVADDVFSAEAMEAIRRFTLRSTVFHHLKSKGYLCALATTGYTAPLIAQMYADLHSALDRVLCEHSLTSAWAYIYDEGASNSTSLESEVASGIGVHADQAAVNINCWITPDASHVDRDGQGGMKVWTKRPNTQDDFGDYNPGGSYEAGLGESGKVIVTQYMPKQDSLTKTVSDVEPIAIPYKQNRCVIFDSAFLHATNKVTFAPGYTNRRINLTFLTGLMGDTCQRAQVRNHAGRVATRAMASTSTTVSE